MVKPEKQEPKPHQSRPTQLRIQRLEQENARLKKELFEKCLEVRVIMTKLTIFKALISSNLQILSFSKGQGTMDEILSEMKLDRGIIP